MRSRNQIKSMHIQTLTFLRGGARKKSPPTPFKTDTRASGHDLMPLAAAAPWHGRTGHTHCAGRHNVAQQSTAKCGVAQHGPAWQSVAQHGKGAVLNAGQLALKEDLISEEP